MSDCPNILLVMTDQQRFDTIAALGNRLIKTPALDALVRRGVSFTQAYTPSPVCVAARSALLSGLPPHVTGCVDNMPMSIATPPSLMQRLANRGYQTHGVGKMHFTSNVRDDWGFESRDTSEEEDSNPDTDDYVRFLRDHGFGHVTSAHGLRSEMYYVPQPSQLPARLHHNRWCVDRSVEFLNRRDASRPFFLMTSFIKPHPPFESPTPWHTLYRGPEMPAPFTPSWSRDTWTYWNHVQNRYKQHDPGRDHRLDRTRAAAYYGCISHLDYELGQLLRHVEQHHPNTVVVFTSDHGELLGDYGCAGKRSMHDAAARVPLIVCWPDGRHAGQRNDTPASLLDIVPTCLAAAGDPEPRPHREGAGLGELAQRPDPKRVVFSQFQRGRYALYLAAGRRAKLLRSEPDGLAWVTRPASLVDAERPIAPPQRGLADEIEAELDHRLRDRFAADGYEHAVESNQWVAYEPPAPLPFDDVDAGLLFQDPASLSDDLAALPEGYRREVPAGFEVERSLLNATDPFVRKTVVQPPADATAPLNAKSTVPVIKSPATRRNPQPVKR